MLCFGLSAAEWADPGGQSADEGPRFPDRGEPAQVGFVVILQYREACEKFVDFGVSLVRFLKLAAKLVSLDEGRTVSLLSLTEYLVLPAKVFIDSRNLVGQLGGIIILPDKAGEAIVVANDELVDDLHLGGSRQ